MQRNDSDSPWKDILEKFFPEFLALLFPQVHEAIDWSAGYRFLDKEFQKIVRDAATGRRYVDKLVETRLKDGRRACLLIHVEVQGSPEKGFALRMFVYHVRIRERFGQQECVLSLGVLADEDPSFRPDTHALDCLGCALRFSFPTAKLLDWRERWRELEDCANPFAVVLMAHLKARESREDMGLRKKWKPRLIRGLYERGLARQQVIDLFSFIDWLLALPEPLEDEAWEETREIEEGRKMPYVTSVERIGMRKGLEQGLRQGLRQGVRQGRRQGLRDSLERLLARRFGELPAWAGEKLDEADIPRLEAWTDALLDAPGLEELLRSTIQPDLGG